MCGQSNPSTPRFCRCEGPRGKGNRQTGHKKEKGMFLVRRTLRGKGRNRGGQSGKKKNPFSRGKSLGKGTAPESMTTGRKGNIPIQVTQPETRGKGIGFMRQKTLAQRDPGGRGKRSAKKKVRFGLSYGQEVHPVTLGDGMKTAQKSNFPKTGGKKEGSLTKTSERVTGRACWKERVHIGTVTGQHREQVNMEKDP